MANFVDQDQQWLLDCLTSTLNTNQDVRSFAEASLQQASLQPGSLLPWLSSPVSSGLMFLSYLQCNWISRDVVEFSGILGSLFICLDEFNEMIWTLLIPEITSFNSSVWTVKEPTLCVRACLDTCAHVYMINYNRCMNSVLRYLYA